MTVWEDWEGVSLKSGWLEMAWGIGEEGGTWPRSPWTRLLGAPDFPLHWSHSAHGDSMI